MVTVFFVFAAAPVMAGKNCAAKCLLRSSCHKVESKTAAADEKHECSGDCTHVTLAIEGMKSNDCEKKVTEALKNTMGVICVRSIDCKSGQAVVCLDTEKGKTEALPEVVSEIGYKTEIASISAGSEKNCKNEDNPEAKKSPSGEKTE